MSSPSARAEGAGATGLTLAMPLVLAQFVASYAGTNMNVAISAIADDLGTSVTGLQTTITLFTLTMAALMIPGSKLSDIWGRKRCFLLGLVIYGIGAVLAALSQGLGLMIVGYSLLQGIGSALMIPPIYILITVSFRDPRARAKWFGAVSGAAGLGAAAGPLIGGLITTTISWRASFIVQALLVALVAFLARRIVDEGALEDRPFDLVGAALSAVGLFFLVFGVLLTSTYGWGTAREAVTIGDVELIPQGGISPFWLFLALGLLVLLLFYRHIVARERGGDEPLLATRIFRNTTSNLGLVTQTLQWLVLQGSFFVISVYVQEIHGKNAIETGIILTPATIGILAASAAAQRMASRHTQRRLIRAGFTTTAIGMALVLAMVRDTASLWAFAPGLFLMGCGIGIMLTSSVNVVQSSNPEGDQGDVSGLSRSVSNLGSSLGTALVGSVMVASARPDGGPFAVALSLLVVLTLLGTFVALILPKQTDTVAGAAETRTGG